MNDMLYPTVVRGAAAAVLAALALLATLDASAQETAPVTEPVRELAKIEIHRKTNAGDLPYRGFFGLQTYVQSLLPRGRNVVELRLRVNFASAKGPAYDEFQPKNWAVAIVGESIDQVVPVSRGGYFLLPDLPQAAAENATIMFNTPTRAERIALEWKFRTSDKQTLSYAEFAKAFDQVRAVQRKIPWDRPGLQEVRLVEYDGLTACFLPGGGRIDVGGKPAATAAEGACRVLKFDAALAGAGAAEIAFVGPLDIVTLHEAGI
jgi:hypothetical protein